MTQSIQSLISTSLFTLAFLFLGTTAYSQQQCCCTNVGCINYNAVAPDCDAWCPFVGQVNAGSNIPYADPASCAAACTLPIELAYFNVKSKGRKGVEINWQTLAELDNKGFEVQRMSGIKHTWETLAFVDGQGSTMETYEYTFLDETPPPGINYYRLRQVDFSGISSFSDVEAVNIEEGTIFAIWPTVAKDVVFVLFSEESRNYSTATKILVHDLMGQLILEQDTNTSTIDIQNFTPGHYLVSFHTKGQVFTHRFIKVQ